MKTSILKLKGVKVLNSTELKSIKGGVGNCSGGKTYCDTTCSCLYVCPAGTLCTM